MKRADWSDAVRQRSQTSYMTISWRDDDTDSLHHEEETSSQLFDLRTMVFRYQEENRVVP